MTTRDGITLRADVYRPVMLKMFGMPKSGQFCPSSGARSIRLIQ
jgi:predicted acyl esterase